MCFICERINMIKDGINPYFVKELETGYVVIGDHQYFKGYSLFLCKKHETELHFLESGFRTKFLTEMAEVAKAVYNAFDAEKMNYECLGNGETHLHWHLFPRRAGDMPIKGPVWWLPREEMYDEKNRIEGAELEVMKSKLLAELNK